MCTDFLDRASLLTQKLLKQDYFAPRLKYVITTTNILRTSSLSGWPLRNVYISNLKTATVFDIFNDLKQIDMSKYHTVVVYVGGNDVSQRMSPNEFIQMHSDIIHFIRHKHCKVVISEILPRAVCNVNYFNSKLNNLCTFENVTYIENARFFCCYPIIQ